ncbi:TRAP transporter substrate-binding protein [Actibacterium lipolyticum]|uniref:Sialic acid-binding periplasmic protein SiaP n=1 Tax=Actibacterium lipolyticum TaxID=1524263 RepID=A0A238L8C6_9RHOB|nr:TRAP transporter substrate-binding protein [Actibacterium lipolyticum]SMX51258.1 Sialic acid-binding periplasmic protein SiaP precursor [Actibacterium lipolyticum]
MSITKIITGAAVALGLSIGSATATELKFANFLPAGHPYVGGAFQPFVDMVAEKTGGDLTVRLYSGGELGPGPVEQYARAVDGVADFAIGLPGYTASNFPRTLVSELPGVLDEATGTQTLWDNIDLLSDEYRRVQLVALWSNASNLLYMRDKPVRTLDDIKGLKIRVPSRNAGLIVEAWGATPVSMPVPEIYNGMQTGVIDGAMIDGTATNAFKLGEVSNFLTVGLDTTISPFFIVMNRDSFKSLSADEQTAVLDAGRAASLLANETQLAVAASGIEAFAKLDGREVITPAADDIAAFNALAASVVPTVTAQLEAEGIPATAIIDALQGK